MTLLDSTRAEEGIQALVPLTQPGGFVPTADFMRQVAKRCAQTSGDLLPFMTTANTARDMDHIRQALGEGKISYFAYSYGTYLGAVYASLFQDRTDRFVLDSSVGPHLVWRQQFRSWGPGGETRFPDFADFIAKNNATYRFGSTPAEVRQTYLRLLAQADRNPVTLPDGTVVNGPMFRELTFAGLYNDARFPETVSIWQVVEGTGIAPVKRAAALNHATPVDNGAASALAVLCSDVEWPRSVEQYRQELEYDRRHFPLFGELGSNIWPCAFWETKPVEPLVPISSQGARNILILENQKDPATPYVGALDMRSLLGERAGLVTINGGGHGIYGMTDNFCAFETTTTYLAQGAFPGDKYCEANTDTTARNLPPTLQKSNTRRIAIDEILHRIRSYSQVRF